MKLIEKLANDYYQERPEGFGEPTEDFMAGFRKAREMLADMVAWRLNGINNGLFNENAIASMPRDIRDFGEEEVSE